MRRGRKSGLFFATSAVAVLIVLAIAGSAATDVQVDLYDVPTASAGLTSITKGPDGKLWFVEQSADALGSIDPSSHTIAEFPLPINETPTGIASDGTDLWVIEHGDFTGVVEIDPSTVTTVASFNTGSAPGAIAIGPDGNPWFTEFGQIQTIQNGNLVAPYSTGASENSSYLASGPDNALWFTLSDSSEVGRVATSDGTVNLYPTPTQNAAPSGIVTGPDDKIWFAEQAPSNIAVLDPSNLQSPTITEYSVPGGSTFSGLASGPSNHLWLAISAPSDIREIDASGNSVGEYYVNPDGTDPTAITVGSDNHIWFTANGSNQIGTLVPVTVPGTPTDVSALAGDGQATVSFSAPANDGGSSITSYGVSATPGSASASGSGSPIVVTGLTNGTSYVFSVTASNAEGTGSAASSNAVVPAGPPKAPTTVTAVRGDKSATVSFGGANAKGSPITSYKVTASPGGATATGTASPLTVAGLTNGVAYTFTVTATSALGTSLVSTASNGVTPAGLPAAPATVTAVRGDKSATVSFAAAAPNGSPVTSYTVTASPGGATATGTGSPLVVNGLTNGTAYTFTVAATNEIGKGAISAISNGVTPAGAPGAPGSVTATRGDQQATVAFTPAAPNGSPVTSYTVTASPGGATATGTGSPIVVTGLADGTGYTFSVVATNAVGAGAAGNSNRVVPAGPPGPPRNVSAAAGNGSATVTFDAAAANGSSVTSYTVTASPGGATATGGGSPLTVAGLTNGTAYTFTVTATNALGVSSASGASNGVTPTGPAATQTTQTTTTAATSTTDTTTTQQTTTEAVATTTTATTPTATTTAAGSSGAPPVDITIAGNSGIQVGDVNISVQGDDMQPGSSVTVTVHSTPQQIGQTTVAADGSFAVAASLPDGLEPGAHEIDVTATRADGTQALWRKLFTVASGGVLGVVGSHPKGILAKLPVYRVRDHVSAALTTATAAVATVGAVGVALGGAVSGLGGLGGGGGGIATGGGGVTGARRRETDGSGGGGGGGGGGSLTGVESERLGAGPPEPGEGDDPAIWKRPGTAGVDGWSSTQPGRIARVSPMLARICVDGEYLRAMLGGPWLLLLLPAAALGVVAAWNTGGAAVPPSLDLFLVILGLSVLDSLLGLVAAVAFGFSVTVAGGIQNASCVRELLAVALVWFALPLGAAAARPLRRHFHLHIDAIWERAADVVIGGLFAAWIVLQMSSALSGVIGFSIPVSQHADAAALAALGFVAARIGLETIAVHAFPRRLYTVHYAGEFEASLWQTLASRAFSIALFVFFAVQYMGNTWALYVGTVIVFSPLLLDPIAERLPKSRIVALLQPTGLVKWAYVIFSGYLAAKLLQHFVHDPTRTVQLGFLLLPIPFLLMIVLAYFAGEPGERRAPNPWLARGAGLLLLVACVWVTV